MKKAALYARVSSDLQQKERTIESQIAELKQQIAAAGNVLVHEYIDDGYSGALLDRPAMDRLRGDLKTDLFDTIYFLNTDRIARDVTYQSIIIGEILKYKKQIIINGKDYVHNPENKFSLTVLGAVSELERAKIIERMTRGKMHRLNQGYLLGTGYNTFGYTYIKRGPDIPAAYVINEREAKIVRYIFETYAKGDIGVQMITRTLEEKKVPTREGRKLWNIAQVKYILKNESYAGVRYFHTRTYLKEPGNPLHKTKYGKRVYRDRAEWIGIKIPAIISRALYDKVKARIEYNRSCYRNPKRKQLFSNLLECGECGCRCFAYQRYYKRKSPGGLRIYYKAAYLCNWRKVAMMHAEGSVKRCHNPEVTATWLETCALEMIRDIMLVPDELKKRMDFFKKRRSINLLRMEKQLKGIEENLRSVSHQKKRIVDLYASGNLSQEEYVKKNREYDSGSEELTFKRSDLLRRIPLLHKPEIVDASVREFCERARMRLDTCKELSTTRQFLLDYGLKVTYRAEAQRLKVILHGTMPVKLKAYDDPDQPTEASTIEFRIERMMSRSEWRAIKHERGVRVGKKSDTAIPKMEYGRLMAVRTPELA